MSGRQRIHRSEAPAPPLRTAPPAVRTAAGTILLLLLALGFVAGCDPGATPPQESGPVAHRTDVPLRVALVGPESLAERIEQLWSAAAPQPLQIETVPADQLAAEATSQDVLVYPAALTGSLARSEVLATLPDAFLASPEVDAERLMAGVRTSILPWGEATVALPLGMPQPALIVSGSLASGESGEVVSWHDYSRILEGVEPGEAAEPLADGWASVMFLWRASTATGSAWLFDRQSFSPQLTAPPYVRALREMVADRGRYPQTLMTPQEVWAGLQGGSIRVALAWPTGLGEASEVGLGAGLVDLRLLETPVADEIYRDGWEPFQGLIGSAMPSGREYQVSISSACRQTAAARQFAGWLSGEETLAQLRGASDVIMPVRASEFEESGGGGRLSGVGGPGGDALRHAYDRWLRVRLADGRTRPALRIPGALHYMEALDREVLAALAGEKSPEAALEAASEAWEELTEQRGRQEQLRAWRRSQGMRGR